MIPEQGVVWITKNEKGLLQALDNNDKLVAKSPTMQQLQKRLDVLYKSNWRAFVGLA